MENLKQEAIRVISALPESATIEESMYELYVVGYVILAMKGRYLLTQGAAL